MILHEHCRALGHEDPGEDYKIAPDMYGTVDPQDGSAPVPVTESQAAELGRQGIAAHRHCGVDGHADPGEPKPGASIERKAMDAVLDWAWRARGSLRGTALWDSYPGPATMMLATAPDPGPAYSREAVLAAINEAADMTAGLMHGDYESSETIAADSAMDMVVNLTTHLLEHPGATVDEAILASWGEDRYEDESDAELVARVKDWVVV